eukprot:gb/GECG01012775.1/.p1 GENE.gb/GECG01012775.1/~~gb/GECG01012775.1/.p1  ORF type:complete len:699 (+),score=94.68 gb/GECG01012775.1/:1-2097(+)
MARGGGGRGGYSSLARDIQRVIHGMTLVAESMVREQTPLVRRRLNRLSAHSSELVARAPEGLSYVASNLQHIRPLDTLWQQQQQPHEEDSNSNGSVPFSASSVEEYVPTNAPKSLDELPSLLTGTQQPQQQTQGHHITRDSTIDLASGMQTATPTTSSADFLNRNGKTQSAATEENYSSLSGGHAAADGIVEETSGAYEDAPRKKLRERSVPSSSLGRLFGFGRMAAGLAFGTASDWVRRSVSAEKNGEAGDSFFMTQGNAERLAAGLSRMRGAALKVGQMLSLQDEDILPKPIADALETVRQQADMMPRRQLDRMLKSELGDNWREMFEEFDETPIAAASIGQVHKGKLKDGRTVAMKVQYPGVAESIDSDLNNFERLLKFGDFFPKGLYLDSMLEVAREELKLECDYLNEAACQKKFRALLDDDPDFVVPDVVDELTSRKVLTSTWVAGFPIDKTVSLPVDIRNGIARRLLRLTLRELFEFRFMQTDPNWGNFFYDPKTGKIGLLDFGASRSYRKPFIDDYLKLVWAASNNDKDTLLQQSLNLGFLTGHESPMMTEAHVDAGMVVGEPFRTSGSFDFKQGGITARVTKHGNVFAHHRLTPPPPETYSLHRKLSGAFLICIHIGANIPCRDLLEKLYSEYKWGSDERDPAPKLTYDTVAASLQRPDIQTRLEHAHGLETRPEMVEKQAAGNATGQRV